MAVFERIRRHGRLTAVVGAVIAAAAVIMPASDCAADGPPAPAETWQPVSLLGFDGDRVSARRARSSVDASGGFLYRRGVFGRGVFTPLHSVPGATATAHLAINDRGEIAGVYFDAERGPNGTYPPGSSHVFVKGRRGGITTFDVPDATAVLPSGMSDRGQIAGVYADAGGMQHGFVLDPDGNATTIDAGPLGTKARDVNDRGDVVGIYGEPADNELGFALPGFLRDQRGRVTVIEVPGAPGTDPTAINDRGQIVGFYTDVPTTVDGRYPPRTQHGFLWDRGRVVRLPDPPGSIQTQPLDINDRGQIVGAYTDAAGRQHGFLYDRGRYTTIDAPRPVDDFALGNIASGINDHGHIVIPEPIVRIEPPTAT